MCIHFSKVTFCRLYWRWRTGSRQACRGCGASLQKQMKCNRALETQFCKEGNRHKMFCYSVSSMLETFRHSENGHITQLLKNVWVTTFLECFTRLENKRKSFLNHPNFSDTSLLLCFDVALEIYLKQTSGDTLLWNKMIVNDTKLNQLFKVDIKLIILFQGHHEGRVGGSLDI